jgi:copper homeostasis protein CutC
MSNSALAKEAIKNVQQLIETNGVSKLSVAIGAGIPPQTFNRLLTGVGGKPLDLNQVQALADHFNVTIHSIVPNEVTS